MFSYEKVKGFHTMDYWVVCPDTGKWQIGNNPQSLVHKSYLLV